MDAKNSGTSSVSDLSVESTESDELSDATAVDDSGPSTPQAQTNGSGKGDSNGLHHTGKGQSPPPSQSAHRDSDRVTVTFGISAAPGLEPIHNLGGWKISALSKTYGKVAKGAKLIQRGEFRVGFESLESPSFKTDVFLSFSRANLIRITTPCMSVILQTGLGSMVSISS